MSASSVRIYHRLQITAHELKKVADRAVSDFGVTTAQLAVMALIDAEGQATQREVASELGVNESAVTAMVRRLHALGFVARSHDEADARVRRLELTEEGRDMLAAAGTPFARINAAIDAVLSEDDLELLAETLDRVRGATRDLANLRVCSAEDRW